MHITGNDFSSLEPVTVDFSENADPVAGANPGQAFIVDRVDIQLVDLDGEVTGPGMNPEFISIIRDACDVSSHLDETGEIPTRNHAVFLDVVVIKDKACSELLDVQSICIQFSALE